MPPIQAVSEPASPVSAISTTRTCPSIEGAAGTPHHRWGTHECRHFARRLARAASRHVRNRGRDRRGSTGNRRRRFDRFRELCERRHGLDRGILHLTHHRSTGRDPGRRSPRCSLQRTQRHGDVDREPGRLDTGPPRPLRRSSADDPLPAPPLQDRDGLRARLLHLVVRTRSHGGGRSRRLPRRLRHGACEQRALYAQHEEHQGLVDKRLGERPRRRHVRLQRRRLARGALGVRLARVFLGAVVEPHDRGAHRDRSGSGKLDRRSRGADERPGRLQPRTARRVPARRLGVLPATSAATGPRHPRRRRLPRPLRPPPPPPAPPPPSPPPPPPTSAASASAPSRRLRLRRHLRLRLRRPPRAAGRSCSRTRRGRATGRSTWRSSR